MNRQTVVPFADISTNFFASFILMLLVALKIDALGSKFEGETIERRALKGEELVDLLYQRRDLRTNMVIDLFGDHVEICGQTVEASQLQAAIAPRSNQKTLLFVFEHNAYTLSTKALMQEGINWSEMSVPQALRDPLSAGWSHAFLNLTERAATREAFKDGLARLLAGGGDTKEVADERPSLSLVPARPRLRDYLHFITTISALIGCALVAAWAEKRPG